MGNNTNPARHIFKTLVKTAAAAVAVMLVSCGGVINAIAFHPEKSYGHEKAALPPGFEDRFIITSDGVRLNCLLARDTGSARALVYFHGNAGNLDRQIGDLLALRAMGLSVLAVDYRGYGESTGRPSETGIYLDGEAAFRYVNDSLGFAERNIFIFGVSLGSAVAVNTAAEKNVAGLILVAPLSSGKDYARAHGLGPLLTASAGNSFDNAAKIGDLRCPLLVVHGTADEVIPLSMGYKLYSLAATQKEFVAIKGGHHGDLASEHGQEYWTAIHRFIKSIRNGQ